MVRTCSECGDPLTGQRPGSKTCGDKCRVARSRRLKRIRNDERELRESGESVRTISEMVRAEAPELVQRVVRDELRPVVRQALTEEVLRSIEEMIALTPRMVQLLQQDMEDEDSAVRQRAYTLLAKYTMGHPGIVGNEDTDSSKQIVVNFNLPRPGEAEYEAEAIEEPKECDMCHATKTTAEFAAGSSRCFECYDNYRTAVIARFTETPA